MSARAHTHTHTHADTGPSRDLHSLMTDLACSPVVQVAAGFHAPSTQSSQAGMTVSLNLAQGAIGNQGCMRRQWVRWQGIQSCIGVLVLRGWEPERLD